MNTVSAYENGYDNLILVFDSSISMWDNDDNEYQL